MCKLTLAFLQKHLCPRLQPPSSSNQFNSKLQISWSILSPSHSKTPSSILRNFSCPLSLQIHCENCPFRLSNNRDRYNSTATPVALNMHREGWPAAAISLCLSFTQITQLLLFFLSLSFFFSWVRGLKQPGSQSSLKANSTSLIHALVKSWNKYS